MSNSKKPDKIDSFDLEEIQGLNMGITIVQSKLEHFIDYVKGKNKIPDNARLDVNTGKITLPEKKKDG